MARQAVANLNSTTISFRDRNFGLGWDRKSNVIGTILFPTLKFKNWIWRLNEAGIKTASFVTASGMTHLPDGRLLLAQAHNQDTVGLPDTALRPGRQGVV